MYKILQLTNNEANVLDEIIRIYKLPLELIREDGIPESDYFVDLETDINYNLLNGIYEILEAINCDDRGLYKEYLNHAQRSVFEKLCNELGIDSSVERIKALEKAAGRVELQLPDERYKLVTEKYNTMPGHEEIDIIIEDQFGNVVQDIVRVQPKVVELTPEKVFHDKNHVTAYIYEDKYDEDYTKKVDIAIYDIDCE
jgi:hypothetical protein